MKQKFQKVEEIEIGEETTIEAVKISQLGENNALTGRFFDINIINDSSSGNLKIIIGGKTGRVHAIVIEEGRINLMRSVKNMDASSLNRPGEEEWLKQDGSWGPEPVKSKRVNAPFSFHMRDILAQ